MQLRPRKDAQNGAAGARRVKAAATQCPAWPHRSVQNHGDKCVILPRLTCTAEKLDAAAALQHASVVFACLFRSTESQARADVPYATERRYETP